MHEYSPLHLRSWSKIIESIQSAAETAILYIHVSSYTVQSSLAVCSLEPVHNYVVLWPAFRHWEKANLKVCEYVLECSACFTVEAPSPAFADHSYINYIRSSYIGIIIDKSLHDT